jgi:hypothetical protein
MSYNVYNIRDINKNNNLIYITLRPTEFPWDSINKEYLLNYDFYWGLTNDNDRNILLNALSEEVKDISTYIVSCTPFYHFLHYMNKKKCNYNLAWIFNESKYDINIIKSMLGDEFQIDKNKSILNSRNDVVSLTIYNNLFIIDNNNAYYIKESLKKVNVPTLFYSEMENIIKDVFQKFNESYEKKTVSSIINNKSIIKLILLNQNQIPKIINKHIFIIKYSYLISFYEKMSSILTFQNFKYLLGIYIYMVLKKKILTICHSKIENILTIIACHNKCNNLYCY